MKNLRYARSSTTKANVNKAVPKKIRAFFVYIAALVFLVLFVFWQNNGIVTTVINYSNPKISESLDGFTIVQISDLHNKSFGKNQTRLLKKIEKESPDIIVVTGDLIDSSRTNVLEAMVFIKGALKIAPVYYVSGNHESWSGIYPELSKQLAGEGVTILDDDEVQIKNTADIIELIGLTDPAFLQTSNAKEVFKQKLKNLTENKEDSLTILLSHRPELLDVYADSHIDLVFTGHAHGGQFRLPFIGGLVAPDQGFFPKFTSGSYSLNDTTMIVSRGLGNSIIPLRLFNRPEIIVVTLLVD